LPGLRDDPACTLNTCQDRPFRPLPALRHLFDFGKLVTD
jgi:hypothetical protein